MSKKPRVVHTPGEQPAADPQVEQPAADQTEQPTGDDGDDELAQLRAEVAALKADKAARTERDTKIAAADKAAMSEKLTSNKPADGLRAVDVDPTKIKRAVLTLDGWVCPVETPAYGGKR